MFVKDYFRIHGSINLATKERKQRNLTSLSHILLHQRLLFNATLRTSFILQYRFQHAKKEHHETSFGERTKEYDSGIDLGDDSVDDFGVPLFFR